MSDQPITDQYLDEIEARCNAAAPGPWRVDYISGNIKAHKATVAYDTWADREGVFIAASRTDIPRLLAEVRRLRAGNATKKEFGQWVPIEFGKGQRKCSKCDRPAPAYRSGQQYLSGFCPGCGAKVDADAQERAGKERDI